ncbi:MAG: copper chaperone PCu(A)C [Casimicrobiaceae bacterium]
MITPVRMWRRLALAAAAAVVSAHAHAVLVINEPWVRPAQAAQATEAYMELQSSDGATLVGARSAAAGRITLVGTHGSTLAVPLPAGRSVLLAPGKFRLALLKLARTLRAGDRVPVTLVLRNGSGATEEIEIDAEVRLRSPTDDHLHPHSHTHAPSG